jgi:hypothetical protein
VGAATGAGPDLGRALASDYFHTYEGTATMQALIVGRDITGVSAFA